MKQTLTELKVCLLDLAPLPKTDKASHFKRCTFGLQTAADLLCRPNKHFVSVVVTDSPAASGTKQAGAFHLYIIKILSFITMSAPPSGEIKQLAGK